MMGPKESWVELEVGPDETVICKACGKKLVTGDVVFRTGGAEKPSGTMLFCGGPEDRLPLSLRTRLEGKRGTQQKHPIRTKDILR
jgi:hypothetical protein